MGKLFDRNTIHDFAALTLVISLLSIGIIVTIQEAGGLLDPSKTIANTSKEFLIHYNNTYNKKRIVILERATLIDGTTTPPKPNSVIVIDGNKIDNVSDTVIYFDRDKNLLYLHNITKSLVLNLTGKFIIPGLFDMHAHVAGVLKNSYNKTKSENFLKILLINGVTTIRNPGGPTKESVGLREKVSA